MRRCSAEIVFFAGRSVSRAEHVHGKSASHHVFSRMGSDAQKIEKVHKECFAQHVDGAPSTAPSELFSARKVDRPAKTRSRPFNDSSW